MHSSAMPTRHAAPAALVLRPQAYARLRFSVAAVFSIFVAFFLYRLTEESSTSVISAIAITTVALAPAFLWASGVVDGLPIFPAYASTLVFTFAVPLVSGHPEIMWNDSDAISSASSCIVLYACIATVCWYAVVVGAKGGRGTYRVLPVDKGYDILLGAIVLGAIHNALVVADLITLDPGLFSAIRAAAIAITSIALFVIAVQLGSGRQKPGRKPLTWAIILFFIVTQLATLYLGAAAISAVALIVGYALGSRRIPWAGILATVLVLGVLHAGKGEMRDRFWWGEGTESLSITGLPAMMFDWTSAGIREIAGPRERATSQPIYERLSLMHLLLLAQGGSAGRADFLNGQSYELIPQMLVPRFVDPNKPSAHEATNLLNQHYGLQTAEDQESTQIAWGIIVESYANFGVAGIAGLAVVIGVILGMATRLTIGAPFMSMRNFAGITMMVISVQGDQTMAVLVTATLQSVVSLGLLLPFCDVQRMSGRA